MDRWRVTSVEKFDYNFERSKNYRTLQRQRINWLPVVAIRRWVHRWMAAAACSDRFVGEGTPVASRTISQRKSWKSSSWRNYPRRPGSDRWANRCTRCLCSKIGHCEAATTVDASQSRGSRCTHIHRIRHSWWWCGWLQLRIKQEKKASFNRVRQFAQRTQTDVSIRSFFTSKFSLPGFVFLQMYVWAKQKYKTRDGPVKQVRMVM